MKPPSLIAGGRGSQVPVASVACGSESSQRTRFGTHPLPSACEILDWIERNAESIFIQQIAPGKRPKNRAVVQYRDDAGEVKAVGGATICAAVARARVRRQVLEEEAI